MRVRDLGLQKQDYFGSFLTTFRARSILRGCWTGLKIDSNQAEDEALLIGGSKTKALCSTNSFGKPVKIRFDP